MNIPFKKIYKNNLYSYLHVSGHKCRNEIECKEEYEDEYLHKTSLSYESQKFNEINSYINLSCYLMSKLEKYATACLHELIKDYQLVKWQYEVLADDFNGMGIDNGFKELKISDANGSKGFFFSLNESVYSSSSFDFTEISIFGIEESRKDKLLEFLRKENTPILEDFLIDGEIFVDIVQGKDYGYFNSFLIKSRLDLDKQMIEFFNATDT